MNLNIEIDDATIVGIILGANVGYWARVASNSLVYTDMSSRTRTFQDGGKLIIDDREQGGTYRLTLMSIRQGLLVMAEKYPRVFAEILTAGQWDSDTGDTLIQCACFGEVRYG